ncbi:unnamed protein product, partial [Mesorhabditis spiculigera]
MFGAETGMKLAFCPLRQCGSRLRSSARARHQRGADGESVRMLPRLAPQRLLLGIVAFASILLFFRALYNAPRAPDETPVRTVPFRFEPIVQPKPPQQQAPPQPIITQEERRDTRCVYKRECASPELTIKLGAETRHSSPFGCLNELKIFEAKDLKKGVNVLVLNEDTLTSENMFSFDVEKTDEPLISWLRQMKEYRVILLVSLGDVAEYISPDARKLLALFGAIQDWRHGSAYAMLGQWGLTSGQAVELTYSLSELATPRSLLDGCYGFPLGDLRNVSYLQNTGTVNRVDEKKLAQFLEPVRVNVKLGDQWANCGRDTSCGEDELPMYFYSGLNKEDAPKMCIGDRIVFARKLNDAGRGLNVAVIDPKSRAVVRVGHFDTYEQESSGLERFLDLVEPGQIVAAVSFDEASTTLSEMAKQILYELGSSMIHRIKFRAAWYFVGQKGINAYTPFEDLNYPTGNNWPAPIKTWICVPINLSGHKDVASLRVVQRQNIPKRHFCAKYDGHDEFCGEKAIDRPIIPMPASDKESGGHPVYNVPIIVVSGLDFDSLRITLEALLALPGINTQMLLVSHNHQYKEPADLAALFHAKPISLNISSQYNDMLKMSVEAAFALFPKATEVIVLEEDTTPTAALLQTMAQLLSVMRQDDDISLVQGFNWNGLQRTSRDEQAVYRVAEHAPAYGFMLKRSVFEHNIKANNACCHELHHWKMTGLDALVVDVSRVTVRSRDPENFGAAVERALVRGPRRQSGMETTLDFGNIGSRQSYLASVQRLVANSTILEVNRTADWKTWKPEAYESVLNRMFDSTERSTVTIRYRSQFKLKALLALFGALHFEDFIPGAFDRYIRFYFDDIHVVLERLQ